MYSIYSTSPISQVLQVRKLEFLMAEVVAQGHDCVITIGGIQSNHCRATAVAARCPVDPLYTSHTPAA